MTAPEPALERLRARLQTRRFGRALHYQATLPSTQTAALAAAEAGAAEGTVFLARQQTQGRGRHGHTWDSPAGAGLYLSLVLRPPGLSPQSALPLTLAFGLAVADAVAATTAATPAIRWPNDLLLDGRKFAGLLLETSAEGDRIHYGVLGIGINLRQRAFPPELAAIATALDDHTPQPTNPEELCAAVLGECERRYGAFTAAGATAVIAEFERRYELTQGQAVVVGGSGPAPYRARTQGLDPSGFLQVELADGSRRLVTSGDVRPG